MGMYIDWVGGARVSGKIEGKGRLDGWGEGGCT